MWFRRRCDEILSNSSFRSFLLQPHQRVNSSSQALPQHLNRVLVQTLNFFFYSLSVSIFIFHSVHRWTHSYAWGWLSCCSGTWASIDILMGWCFPLQTSLLESGIPSIIAWTLERESIPTTLCCCFLWNITGPRCLIYMIWIFFILHLIDFFLPYMCVLCLSEDIKIVKL